MADLILPKPFAQFGRDKADVAHYLYRLQYTGRLWQVLRTLIYGTVEQFSRCTTPSAAMNEETPHTATERPATYSLSGVCGSTYLTRK